MMSQHRSFQAQRAGAAGRAPATKGTPSGSPRAEDKLLVLLEKPLYGRRPRSPSPALTTQFAARASQ